MIFHAEEPEPKKDERQVDRSIPKRIQYSYPEVGA